MAYRSQPTRYANHPMTRWVRSMDGGFLLPREVAAMLGVTKRTLIDIRRRTTPSLGPTHQATYGGVVVHLYTPARVTQIAEYMKAQVGDKLPARRHPGTVTMWTEAEMHGRRRAFDRARTYRNRAKTYREAGKVEQATDLEGRAAKLTGELEKSRHKRARLLRAAHRK